MSQINVLWIIDHVCYDGSLHGGGRLYWSIVPRFDSKRYRIVPCFLRASGTVRNVFAKSPIPIKILNKSKYDLTTLWTIINLIKEENIQVMHLHCYASSSFGRLASLITGVPAIIHDYDTQIYFPYLWYLAMLDKFLSPVTRVAVAASPMVKNYMIKKRGINSNKVRMMFHAVPSEKYTSVQREQIVKTKNMLGIAEDTKIVGTPTKLGLKRGNEYLLKAASEVVKLFPNVVFLIIYKPTYYHRIPKEYKGFKYIYNKDAMKAELESLIKELKIEKNVRLIESLNTMDEFVSICDLVVAPFLDERFSSVNLLEAMAMGKPIIATDMGEQREIIKNGLNGYLVTPGDVKELAGRILRILSNPDELTKMSRQAKDASTQYSVDAYVKNLELCYAELAANKKD